MTDDIVTRLRERAELPGLWAVKPNFIKAADRIEKLEAALREIEECDQDPRLSRQSCVEQLQSIARAALAGEKKDD